MFSFILINYLPIILSSEALSPLASSLPQLVINVK